MKYMTFFLALIGLCGKSHTLSFPGGARYIMPPDEGGSSNGTVRDTSFVPDVPPTTNPSLAGETTGAEDHTAPPPNSESNTGQGDNAGSVPLANVQMGGLSGDGQPFAQPGQETIAVVHQVYTAAEVIAEAVSAPPTPPDPINEVKARIKAAITRCDEREKAILTVDVQRALDANNAEREQFNKMLRFMEEDAETAEFLALAFKTQIRLS